MKNKVTKEKCCYEFDPKMLSPFFINNLDIRQKSSAAMSLNKIIIGITMIADYHGKIITTILPVIKALYKCNNEKSIKAAKLSLEKVIKNFIRSKEAALNIDEDMKEMMMDTFVIPSQMVFLSLKSNGENEDTTITIKGIVEAYDKTMEDISSMISYPYSMWKRKFKDIETDIKNIYEELASFENDISMAFVNVYETENPFDTTNLYEIMDSVNIKTQCDIVDSFRYTLKCLDDTFLNCCSIYDAIMRTIDISNPNKFASFDSMDDLLKCVVNGLNEDGTEIDNDEF